MTTWRTILKRRSSIAVERREIQWEIQNGNVWTTVILYQVPVVFVSVCTTESATSDTSLNLSSSTAWVIIKLTTWNVKTWSVKPCTVDFSSYKYICVHYIKSRMLLHWVRQVEIKQGATYGEKDSSFQWKRSPNGHAPIILGVHFVHKTRDLRQQNCNESIIWGKKFSNSGHQNAWYLPTRAKLKYCPYDYFKIFQPVKTNPFTVITALVNS